PSFSISSFKLALPFLYLLRPRWRPQAQPLTNLQTIIMSQSPLSRRPLKRPRPRRWRQLRLGQVAEASPVAVQVAGEAREVWRLAGAAVVADKTTNRLPRAPTAASRTSASCRTGMHLRRTQMQRPALLARSQTRAPMKRSSSAAVLAAQSRASRVTASGWAGRRVSALDPAD